jgi:hypothetical protein
MVVKCNKHGGDEKFPHMLTEKYSKYFSSKPLRAPIQQGVLCTCFIYTSQNNFVAGIQLYVIWIWVVSSAAS